MEKAAEWVILELMGHRVLAGRLSEVERAGTKLLRIEIPLGTPPADGSAEKFFVQDYSGSALYGVTPVPEEVAREKARFYRPANSAALLGAGPPPAPPELELDEEGFMGETPPPRPPPMYECEEGCKVTADTPEEAQAHSDATGHLMARLRGEGPLITPRQALTRSAEPMVPAVVVTSTTGPDDPPTA